MFSKKMTNKSTNACLAQINRLKEKMEKADAVIIGAGAGLSTSAGFILFLFGLLSGRRSGFRCFHVKFPPFSQTA